MQSVVVFLDEKPEGGGAFQYSWAIIQAIISQPKAFSPTFLYTNLEWERQLAKIAGDKKFIKIPAWVRFFRRLIRKYNLPLQSMLRFLITISPFGQFLKKWKSHYWIYPGQDDYSYLFPTKSITAIHDLMHRYGKEFPEVFGESGWRDRHFLKICQYSKMVFVDSEVGKDHVCESYGREWAKIVKVLPFTTNFSKGSPFVKPQQFILPERFFFYPAQYWQHKNHQILVSALAELREDFPEMHFVFSGAPKNAGENLFQQIRTLGLQKNISHLGFVSEMELVWLYKNAVAMIMPSFFGPTNIPPLEAMALGCPMALADVYAMREQSGDAAIYFSPSDTHGLAQIMRKLWTDNSLRLELKEKAEERFQLLSPIKFADNFSRHFSMLEGEKT